MDDIADSAFGPALPRNILDTLFDTELRIRRGHATQLGHPYNLLPLPSLPQTMAVLPLGDPGDPQAVGGAALRDLERQVIGWLAQVWGGSGPDQHAGMVCANGTEANLRALHLAREILPRAVLLHGSGAHGSLPAAARLLGLEAREVGSLPSGEIDLDDLSRQLGALGDRPVILALTCGTWAAGAHDDVAGAIARLEAAGHGADRRFVHLDAALSGMVLPFLPAAPPNLRPDFGHGIDSIATCGHKMIGTPMPCGVLVFRKALLARLDEAERLSAPAGARDGHAILALWTRLMAQGVAGFARDALRCTLRAADLARSLRAMGAEAALNPHSLTVTFPEPDAEIVATYRLPCQQGKARAIIMPSVSDALIERFLSVYADWFRVAGRGD